MEDFWSLYNHIETPSKLPFGSDYSLFKVWMPPDTNILQPYSLRKGSFQTGRTHGMPLVEGGWWGWIGENLIMLTSCERTPSHLKIFQLDRQQRNEKLDPHWLEILFFLIGEHAGRNAHQVQHIVGHLGDQIVLRWMARWWTCAVRGTSWPCGCQTALIVKLWWAKIIASALRWRILYDIGWNLCRVGQYWRRLKNWLYSTFPQLNIGKMVKERLGIPENKSIVFNVHKVCITLIQMALTKNYSFANLSQAHCLVGCWQKLNFFCHLILAGVDDIQNLTQKIAGRENCAKGEWQEKNGGVNVESSRISTKVYLLSVFLDSACYIKTINWDLMFSGIWELSLFKKNKFCSRHFDY